MSREIKFRAWDIYTKKMKSPHDLYISGQGDEALTVNISRHNTQVMQYTGLKDKNGVEIYEGDILAIKAAGPISYGEVIFEQGAFLMTNKSLVEKPNVYDVATFIPYEVIGNIYENPELLK